MSGNDDTYNKLLEESKDRIDAPHTETARARKWRILKNKATELKSSAYQGFIIGSLVGGGFGFITGFYYAFQQRRLSLIPLSTIISGVSFGFIMACGSMIRSDDCDAYEQNYEVNGIKVPIQQYWIMRHKN